ncbi:hypothetical protein N665_0064s0005 [Sinapis alba]|nr:hypothetical protein N665_0064s0005 [Sinapis alba]
MVGYIYFNLIQIQYGTNIWENFRTCTQACSPDVVKQITPITIGVESKDIFWHI